MKFMEKHPLHLKHPNLQTSSEVNRAVVRQERKTGEKIPNDPAERIDAYMDRLERLFLDPEGVQHKKEMGDLLETERPRALSLIREMILEEYIRPNKERMAEGAAILEGRAARQMGIDVRYQEEQLEQRGEIAAGDLESSLDQWMTYLSDPNEPYPTWFRYYTFRNILSLGEYDKDKQIFPERSKGTFKLFPEIDRGALAYVQEMMEAAQDDTVLVRVRDAQRSLWQTPESELLTKERAVVFASLSFAKQYAEGLKQNGEISQELRAETRGEWFHYKQGDDPKYLWISLQNKGTAWCTKGYPTAETQLSNGDFYVYYTLDATGEPNIPRIAIRMYGDKTIAENPRGVLDTAQNVEVNMLPILNKKLNELKADGVAVEQFQKKSEDMRKLTTLERKKEKGEPFMRSDLMFLYEINSNIEGFGYEKDPRIAEIRKDRNIEEDMLIIFECTKDQIARVPSEINENTKAYVVQIEPGISQKFPLPRNILEPGIFQKFPETLEYVYTSFPKKRIRIETVEIGGKSKEQLISEMEVSGINFPDYVKSMMDNPDFIVTENREKVKLIHLSFIDLGFITDVVVDREQIFERAQALGLELCSPDTGPNYRLQYKDQPFNKRVQIGMKQIAYSDSKPGLGVFELLSYATGGLCLNHPRIRPGNTINNEIEIVFRLPSKK